MAETKTDNTKSAGPILLRMSRRIFSVSEDFGPSPVSMNQSSPFILIQRLPLGV